MAYFIITEVLRPNLGPRARIVSTASVAHNFGRLDFDDLQSEKRYSAMSAYGTSKLDNILWTCELSRRLASTGITANCYHPGGVNTNFGHNTKGVLSSLMRFGQRFALTPEQGADTLVWLASAREVEGRTGGYWAKRKLVQPSAAARDPDNVSRLWAASERIAAL
jgi:NAD(P)-dependent dehydrogenase (short-subunit alcohol dehydrogenase family)